MVATLLSILSQFSGEIMTNKERTFIMIKPDGVHRGIVGDIIKRFEQKGFKLVSMKFMWLLGHIWVDKDLKVWLVDDMAKIDKFEDAVDAVQKRLKLFKLKPQQAMAISHLISGKHTFCLLPTGYGKSAIYGILPLIKDEASKELLGKHYKDLSSKPFFNDLVGYMHSGPVVPMASEELLKNHYADLAGRSFFPGLIKYMSSGPVVPMVWEGLNVVKTGRKMLGETNPIDSLPGTIRGDYCIQVGRNICHGSDAVESAEREMNMWFSKEEQITWTPCAEDWVYE